MQGFPIFTKVLRARHQLAHLFQNGQRAPADLGPRTAESVDRGGPERGDNGGQGGKIVEGPAFLIQVSNSFQGGRVGSVRLPRSQSV